MTSPTHAVIRSEADAMRRDDGACRVCGVATPTLFLTCGDKTYFRCHNCQATLLDVANFPSREAEGAHYLSHENDPDDSRYRAFLSRLFDPLQERLSPQCHGLDFGCGPGPALARMLEEAGHSMSLYDPFFAADQSVLERSYDFITCTETAEHFHNPGQEFARFDRLLRPGGWLGVMTCFQSEDARFAKWHYRLDPTHVVFYRAETFRVIAQRFSWHCTVPVKDVALMQKPLSSSHKPKK